jgi:hypothetical protein
MSHLALADSFSAVPWASGIIFMFCAPGLIFGGTEGVGSCFYVLRARTRFRRYRGHRAPFSCFVLPDSFLAMPNASCPVFIFCKPELFFSGIKGVRSHFALADSFSTVPWMFCASRLIYGGAECVGIFFNGLHTRTRFQWYRGRRVPFSCFALPDSFSMVLRAPRLVFMFYTPGLVFGGVECVGFRLMFCAPGIISGCTEGVGSRFHVLRSRTCFRRFLVRRVSFSSFARPDSFSAVPRASGPDFMFCAPRLVFCGAMCVGSRFHVLRALTRFRRYRRRRVPFLCFA